MTSFYKLVNKIDLISDNQWIEKLENSSPKTV